MYNERLYGTLTFRRRTVFFSEFALYLLFSVKSFTNMYFFRYGLGYMKGNERYTVFMGVNFTVGDIFIFHFVDTCVLN